MDGAQYGWIPKGRRGGYPAAVVGLFALFLAACAGPVRSPAPSACPEGPWHWMRTASMAQARSSPATTLLTDGRVLVVGGDNGTAYLASAEIYDPADQRWTPAGTMSRRRSGPTVTLLGDGRVLVAGGNGPETGTAELFDPDTGAWVDAGEMNHSRWHQTATLLNDGKVLMVGGLGGIGGSGASDAHTQPAELFDPAAGTWTRAEPMVHNRTGHTATILADGRVLVAGGRTQSSGQPKAWAEIYDPTTNLWAATGDLLVERAGHAAVRLADGTVLVVGGGTIGGASATTAELFDPATGTWRAARSADLEPISDAAATLCDGIVLFAGGSGQIPAQFFDPRFGAFGRTSEMVTLRSSNTLTTLSAGGALVVGGIDESGTVLDSAEIYGPPPG